MCKSRVNRCDSCDETGLTALAATITDPNPLRDRDLVRIERNKPVNGLDIILAGQAPDKPDETPQHRRQLEALRRPERPPRTLSPRP